MARRVTLSALGPPMPGFTRNDSYSAIIKQYIAHWSAQIGQVIPDKPDLIVLHEACDWPDGFTREWYAEYDTERGERVRDALAKIAADNNCYIGYCAYRVASDGTLRNRMEYIGRDGGCAGFYDKNHVVMSECEQYGVKYGKSCDLIELDFGTVASAICFDLNFDELRRQYSEKKPDLIVFSSMYHGALMQQYWAYSCRAYFIGAIVDSPCSILSPCGEILKSSTNYFKYVTADINLDCLVAHLDRNWERIAACKEKYGRGFTMRDTGYLGAVLLSCEREDMNIDQMAEEFCIERLDDYLNLSLEHRRIPGNTAD